MGLLVQPFYVALMVMTLQQQQATCITYSFFAVVVYIFSGASFLSIICESVDGFLAIRQYGNTVPRTCDFQTCHCCSDLSLAVVFHMIH